MKSCPSSVREAWARSIARDTRLDRTVAIKILAPALASDAEFRDRFEREARPISALNHPNVCTRYDVAPDYLVMELVEGQSLEDRIVRSGGIPVRDALRIAHQIADALGAAHDRGSSTAISRRPTSASRRRNQIHALG
jgi:serine/threonine protein kinase